MTDSNALFPLQRVTRLPGGYMGKILRVDLTSRILTDENLPEELVLRKFIGGCWFAQMQNKPDGLRSVLDSFNATTGWRFDMNEALVAGHRSAILQGIFGTQRGWVAEDDWTKVGPRFLEPIPDGKNKGFTIAKWLPGMIYDYHRASGRHEKTGRPFMDTLTKLGLEEFREWSQLD